MICGSKYWRPTGNSNFRPSLINSNPHLLKMVLISLLSRMGMATELATNPRHPRMICITPSSHHAISLTSSVMASFSIGQAGLLVHDLVRRLFGVTREAWPRFQQESEFKRSLSEVRLGEVLVTRLSASNFRDVIAWTHLNSGIANLPDPFWTNRLEIPSWSLLHQTKGNSPL